MPHKAFFGDLEQAVMETVWRHGQVTVRDVLGHLERRRSVAYTTVMTVMNRLVEQGHLRRRMSEHGAYVYRPTHTALDHGKAATRVSVDRLVRLYGDAALVQFLETLDEIPPARLAQLRQQLRSHPDHD